MADMTVSPYPYGGILLPPQTMPLRLHEFFIFVIYFFDNFLRELSKHKQI